MPPFLARSSVTTAFAGEKVGPIMTSILSLSTAARALSAPAGVGPLSALMYSMGRPAI